MPIFLRLKIAYILNFKFIDHGKVAISHQADRDMRTYGVMIYAALVRQ